MSTVIAPHSPCTPVGRCRPGAGPDGSPPSIPLPPAPGRLSSPERSERCSWRHSQVNFPSSLRSSPDCAACSTRLCSSVIPAWIGPGNCALPKWVVEGEEEFVADGAVRRTGRLRFVRGSVPRLRAGKYNVHDQWHGGRYVRRSSSGATVTAKHLGSGVMTTAVSNNGERSNSIRRQPECAALESVRLRRLSHSCAVAHPIQERSGAVKTEHRRAA